MSIEQARSHLLQALEILDALDGKPANTPETPPDAPPPPDPYADDDLPVSMDEVREAITEASLLPTFGPLKVTEVMNTLGADRVSDLKPEQYQDFIDALDRATQAVPNDE